MISETDGNRILFKYMIGIGIEKGIGSSYEVLGLRSDQDRDRSDRIEGETTTTTLPVIFCLLISISSRRKRDRFNDVKKGIFSFI